MHPTKANPLMRGTRFSKNHATIIKPKVAAGHAKKALARSESNVLRNPALDMTDRGSKTK